MRWGLACVLLFACGSVNKVTPDAKVDAAHDAAPDAETVVVLSDLMAPAGPLDTEVGYASTSVHVHTAQPNQMARVAFSGTLGKFTPPLVTVMTDGSGDGSASSLYAPGSAAGAETVSVIGALNGVESAAATAMFNLSKVTVAGYGVPFDGDGGFGQNYLLGQPITVAAPGMLTKVGFWSQTDGPNIKIGIYTANGAQPGTLIAQAGPVAVVHGMTEVTLASPVQLAAGTYWYEAIYDTTGHIGADTSNTTGTGTIAYISLAYANALPTTFPTPSTYTGEHFNYFLVFQ